MDNFIKHNNIFYIRDFGEIGGVETFTFEMVKKFKDLDIAVVYVTASQGQLERLRPYCKFYKHIGQRIECKVAIINYDISIIDYINEDAKIYQVVHGDYSHEAYTWKPPTHERIYKYIGVTKYIAESFKRITGLENVTYGYNPLTIEDKPFLKLVSATRLSKIKGKDRMIRLANALTNAGIDFIWYIFTNDKTVINNPNVIYMKPRLDVSKWIREADYIVQLSDTEACSYTINEALYRNVPVIVTPLPYLKEIGVEDGVNGYILDFDCGNMKHIIDNITNVPKFNFKQLPDKYNKLLAKGKSKYQEDKKQLVDVICISPYFDMRLSTGVDIGETITVDIIRAEELIGAGVCKLKDIKEKAKT